MLPSQGTTNKTETFLLQRSNIFIVTLSTDISAPAERYVGANTLHSAGVQECGYTVFYRHSTPLERSIYEARPKIEIPLKTSLQQTENVQTIVNVKRKCSLYIGL